MTWSPTGTWRPWRGRRGAAGNPSTATYTWENQEPTASYLVMFHAADLDVAIGEGPGGITLIEAFPPELPAGEDALRPRAGDDRRLHGAIRSLSVCLARQHGVRRQPFNAALETQGMIGYDSSAVNERTIAHEVAHQWFGDSVSPARWQDIWLNEGFARYSEILWAEAAHGPDAAEAALQRQIAAFATVSRTADGTGVLIGDPGPEQLFTEVLYAGGAVLLHELRQRLGDEAFFRLLQEWAARYALQRDNRGVHRPRRRDLRRGSGRLLHRLALHPVDAGAGRGSVPTGWDADTIAGR